MSVSRILAGVAMAFSFSAVLSLALARSRWTFWPRDKPNERSLHTAPTPRTGGLAILLGLAASLAVTVGRPAGDAVWVSAAVTLLAIVSFVDDLRGLPVGVRLCTHAVAAAAAVWGAGLAAPRMWVPLFGVVELGALAAPLSFLGVLWLTNLYNFMDGMDGLAGAMTVIGASVLGFASWESGDVGGAAVAFLLSAAAAGFLLQNRPPAKIFLGDVGAIPIGFLLSVLALRASVRGSLDIGASCLVFSPFIVDATITLLRRLFAGERVWSAHRSHCYQRLVLSGYTHAAVLRREVALMVVSGGAALVYEPAGDALRAALLAALALLYAFAALATARAEARFRA